VRKPFVLLCIFFIINLFLFLFLNIESLITNDLLANNNKPAEVPIQDHLEDHLSIPIKASTQQNEKINISGKKPLVL